MSVCFKSYKLSSKLTYFRLPIAFRLAEQFPKVYKMPMKTFNICKLTLKMMYAGDWLSGTKREEAEEKGGSCGDQLFR